MNGGGELPLLVTGLLAGLLGSGHCFGMCGGIAGTLGATTSVSGRGTLRWLPGILFNLGRIFSYMALGVLAASLLFSAGNVLNVPHWARMLRLVTALMIALIGLQFLFDIRLLKRIERAGAGLWRLVQPLAVRMSGGQGASSRILLGVCWGFLPCGLVYSMVLTGASTGSPFQAALVMLAFGVGTLPSMLGMTWLSPALGILLKDPTVRKITGFSLLVLAAWTLLSMNPGHSGAMSH